MSAVRFDSQAAIDFLGQAFPWLSDKIDWVILGLLLLTVIPIGYEWRRNRRQEREEATTGS